MSDNVPITPGTGMTVAADEVIDATLGTVKVQYVKLMDGTNDGTAKAAVGPNGLKVDPSAVTQPISALSLPLPDGASTEATLSDAKGLLNDIKTALASLNLKDFSTEATLADVLNAVDGLEALLTSIDQKDFATQTTLAAVNSALSDVKSKLDTLIAKDYATESTLTSRATESTLIAVKNDLDTLNGKDFATQTTLAAIKAKTDNLDAALSTLATESTLMQVETILSSIDGNDFAKESTLSTMSGKLPAPVSGKVPVDGSGVTQPVSAASLPLPTGAATETTLSALNTKVPAAVGGRVPVDGSGVTQPVSATALPLPTGAATEATLATRLTDAQLRATPVPVSGPLTDAQLRAAAVPISASALPLPSGAATSAKQDTGNTSLASIDTKLPASGLASETTLGTRLADATFTGRVGEVQASPTANTVLARLKDIVTQMTTQVRGLFDSAGNAIASAINFGDRRILVASMDQAVRLTDLGGSYSALAAGINLPSGGTFTPILMLNNPAASGKTLLIDMISMGIANGSLATFRININPTTTANGTALTIAPMKAGGGAGVATAFSGPTVTAATGADFDETVLGTAQNTLKMDIFYKIQLPAGTKLVVSGAPSANNKVSSASIRWTEV